MEPARFTQNIGGNEYKAIIDKGSYHPQLKVLTDNRVYSIVHKCFFGTDPSNLKAAKIIHSQEFSDAIDKGDWNNPQANTGDYNICTLMDQPLSIESYAVDREASRGFTFDEIAKELDRLIIAFKKNIEKDESWPNNKSEGGSPLTTYVYHLVSRVADYRLSLPSDVAGENNYAYLDKNDVLQICTLDKLENYEFARNHTKETHHILQVLRRLLEKDKADKENDPQAILHHLTFHEGFQKRLTLEKIKGLACVGVSVVSAALAAFACYKGYYKYFPAI